MKKFVVRFLGAVLLLLLAANVGGAQTVDKYFKAGGELRLSPVPVSDEISSIVWKHGKNLLAEWVDGSIPLTYYGSFKSRSELNIVTGELVVRSLTVADTGLYSVEINNNVQSQVYQTVVIQDVPEPVVEVKPLVCSPALPSCKLVCAGNITNAGPVSYFWKKDDGEWKDSQNNTIDILNDEETQRVKTFSCKMKNPLSERDSKTIDNRFYKKEEDAPSGGGAGGIVAGVIILIAVAGAAVSVYFLYKHKLLCFKNCGGRTLVSTNDREGGHTSSSPADANGGAGDKPNGGAGDKQP